MGTCTLIRSNIAQLQFMFESSDCLFDFDSFCENIFCQKSNVLLRFTSKRKMTKRRLISAHLIKGRLTAIKIVKFRKIQSLILIKLKMKKQEEESNNI